MSSLDLDDFHSEQETTRLALMGDAVCIAASSIYFTVRLLDATVDLFFDYSTTTSSATYKTFLEFKKSEELGNLIFSLVYPLVFMRVFGCFKDMYFAFCKTSGGGADETRLVLDFSDFIIVSFALMWSFGVIPALEHKVLVEKNGDLLRRSSAFYDLEFAHLLALAQAGLLALLSLLKLFARLERAAVRHKLFFLAAVAAAREEEETEGEEEEEDKEQVVEDKQVAAFPALVQEQQQSVLWKRVEVVDEPTEKHHVAIPEEENEDEDIPMGMAFLVGACTFFLTLKVL